MATENMNSASGSMLAAGMASAPSPVFTLFDSTLMSPHNFISHLLGNIQGIEIIEGSANFIGADLSASSFSGVHFGQNLGLDHPGILLSSGHGAPALTNTNSSFSVSHAGSIWVEYPEPVVIEHPVFDEYGEPLLDDEGNPVYEQEVIEGQLYYQNNGDSALTKIAQMAFENAGQTYDASIIEFSFRVVDSNVRSINLDVLFGSEEYPTFVDSPYVDIAAVIVNGTNYAYLDGDITKPLSIVGATTEDGRFLDNTTSFMIDEETFEEVTIAPSPFHIEYNGLTPKLTISIPLNEEDNLYHVRIGIADTGDTILDSGLFVSNLRTSSAQFEGTLVNVEASDEGSELVAASPTTATLFTGGAGNDTMTGSTSADVYDLSKGGSNTIKGSFEQLNGDTVMGFSQQDSIQVTGETFTDDQLTVTMGSAILAIDLNDDGTIDSTIRLEGDFTKGVFRTNETDEGTAIAFHVGKQSVDRLQVITDDMANISLGNGELVQLFGDTSGRLITIEKGAGATNLSAGSQVVLKGIYADDVRVVRDGTTLSILDNDANLLVQMAASTQEASYVWLEDGFAKLEANLATSSLTFAEQVLADAHDLALADQLEWIALEDAPEALLVGIHADVV